jgi:hypothetical protein
LSPTEGARVPNGEREWPDRGLDGCPTKGGVSRGGPTAGLGGGPTGDYISAAGPLFWALSSCAQSHLQERPERRLLMSESGPLRGEFRKELPRAVWRVVKSSGSRIFFYALFARTCFRERFVF